MQTPNRQRPVQRSRGATPTQQQQPKVQAGWGHAVQTMEEDSKLHVNTERRLPFNFFLKPNESAKIVLLDYSVEGDGVNDHGLWLMHEHIFAHPVSGKWPIYETCSHSIDGYCPICTGEVTGTPDVPKYHLVMSILDTTEYINKQTGEKIPYSRKLVRFKSSVKSEHNHMMRMTELLKGVMEEHGTLRGVMLNMARPDDKMSPSHGLPTIIPKSGGRSFAKISDKKFMETFGHPEIKSKDGKTVLYEANEKTTPFDYLKHFPKPSADDIAERYNVLVGQRAVVERSLIDEPQTSYEKADAGTASVQQADANGFEFDDLLNDDDTPDENLDVQPTDQVDNQQQPEDDGFDDDDLLNPQ